MCLWYTEDMYFLCSSLLLMQTALPHSARSIDIGFPQNGFMVSSGESRQMQKRSAEITFSSNKTSGSNGTDQCHYTRIGLRRCAKYEYAHCREVFKWSNSTMVSTNCSQSQKRQDDILKNLESTMQKHHGASDDCVKSSRWVLCIYTFPACNKTHAVKDLLCKEACSLVKDVICEKEWKQVVAWKEGSLISADIDIPDCKNVPYNFPSMENSSCLYPDLLHDMKRKYTKKDSKNNIIIIIAAGAGGGLLLLILLAVLASVCLKRSRRKKNSSKEFRMGSLKRKSEAFEEVDAHGYDVPGHDNPLYASADLKAALSSFEKLNVKLFPRNELMFLNDLGEGAFGKVVKCEIVGEMAAGKTTISAVKYLKDDASDHTRSSFLREAKALASFSHPNIVSVLGVCLDDQGPPCLILEFMKFGDLAEYIRKRSGSYHASFGENGALPEDVEFKPPMTSFRELVFMARQIAAGMQYLAGKKYVHRDLATRNCLVGDQMVVKIGDFGLGHDISSEDGDYYRIDAQRLLPIRWLPPEALTVGKFTMQSDIWSFGVLIWELFTYGLQPYCGQSNEEVVKRIRSFKLLECPDGCPRKVYLLMRACWKYEQSKRMPFKKIQEMLAGWLEGRGEFLDEAWEEMQKPPLKNSGAHSESKNSTPPVPARTRLKTPQENTPP